MSVSRSFHDLHFIAKSLHRFTTVRQRLCCCWYVKSKTHSAARLPRVNYKVFAVCVLCLHIGFCHLYNLHKQQGQLLNGCKKHTHTRAHARTRLLYGFLLRHHFSFQHFGNMAAERITDSISCAHAPTRTHTWWCMLHVCRGTALHVSTSGASAIRGVCIFIWCAHNVMLMMAINKEWHHLLCAGASAPHSVCLPQHWRDGQLFNNPAENKSVRPTPGGSFFNWELCCDTLRCCRMLTEPRTVDSVMGTGLQHPL